MKLIRTLKSLSLFIISALFYGGLFAAPVQTADYVAGKAPKIGGGYAVTGQIPQVDYTTEIYDATNGLPTSDANFILGSKSGKGQPPIYTKIFKKQEVFLINCHKNLRRRRL